MARATALMCANVPTPLHTTDTLEFGIPRLEKSVNWKEAIKGRWHLPRIDRAAQSGLDPSTDERTATHIHQAEPARMRRRVRTWRRRVLLRRGARMHAVMGTEAESCSLAMLDEEGVVVSWYGAADKNQPADAHVINRHVSQFYVPDDIARSQPTRDLHAAIVAGKSVREGWRRRPDGLAFWGTTEIEAVKLRDGRLQGFSYLTRGSQNPCVDMSVALRVPEAEVDRDWDHGGRRVIAPRPQDRMARSRSAARQRRLFKLARRMREPTSVELASRSSAEIADPPREEMRIE